MITRPPLSVLDLVPIVAGSSPHEALAHALDLARRVEALGYRRYWVAEHHLAPGVAGSAPAVVLALVADATRHIRVGSGAVQMGHHTPLAVVEQFGILDAAHPGRIDLGLGRSLGRRATRPASEPDPEAAPAPPPPIPLPVGAAAASPGRHTTERGLLIPEGFDPRPLLASPRFRFHLSLLQQPGATTPDYAEQVDEVLALLRGELRSPEGLDVHAVPGEGAGVEVWILGSSGGASAAVAGRRGLPFAGNYHISPSTVLDSVAAYRAAFRPSGVLERPHVMVSADVVVAPTSDEARRLAEPYALWVRSIRIGRGAMRYPDPEEAARHRWSDEDRALVADRVDTQFVGSPGAVADRLEVLVDETGADELLVTTITHDHADRVRSYELLAQEWADRGR